MRRVRFSALLIGLVAILALVAAGCGGYDDDERRRQRLRRHPSGGAPAEGKQGGDLTFLAAADVDYLDPGQSYYTFGYQVLYSVNRPLYSFSPDEPDKPQPDLAEGEPQISEDKKDDHGQDQDRHQVRPAGRPRGDRPRTSSTPSSVPSAPTCRPATRPPTSATSSARPTSPTKGVKPISGIETPDDQTLVIKLDRPVAVTRRRRARDADHRPGPGGVRGEVRHEVPVRLRPVRRLHRPVHGQERRARASSIGRDPGKRIELVRNPNWNKDTDYRPAYLDSITIEEGNDDLTVASRRTLAGPRRSCAATPASRRSRSSSARSRSNKEQLGRVCRRRHALDRAEHRPRSRSTTSTSARPSSPASTATALRLTRGGEFIGPIAQGFIPPGIPGLEESGGEAGLRRRVRLDGQPEG